MSSLKTFFAALPAVLLTAACGANSLHVVQFSGPNAARQTDGTVLVRVHLSCESAGAPSGGAQAGAVCGSGAQPPCVRARWIDRAIDINAVDAQTGQPAEADVQTIDAQESCLAAPLEVGSDTWLEVRSAKPIPPGTHLLFQAVLDRGTGSVALFDSP
jgi:hypothetical protein